MNNRQSGFTLVEIAIVLVIIGLLLGGVLKGQELINSAKVKNMVGDFRTVSSLVYAYQDRFRVFPGDQTQAQLNDAFGAAIGSMRPSGRRELRPEQWPDRWRLERRRRWAWRSY